MFTLIKSALTLILRLPTDTYNRCCEFLYAATELLTIALNVTLLYPINTTSLGVYYLGLCAKLDSVQSKAASAHVSSIRGVWCAVSVEIFKV